jgi:hypothetical protein
MDLKKYFLESANLKQKFILENENKLKEIIESIITTFKN